LNFPFYIAQRVAGGGQGSFARLIIRIAVAAVALSIAVMLLATALIKGFKTEISEKMFGFWGHIHIASTQTTTTFEPIPIERNQPFLPAVNSLGKIGYTTEGGQKRQTLGGVHHIQAFATKAGIIKTSDNFEGIVLKGVGTDFDWAFVEGNLVEGRRIQHNASADSTADILVSSSTANRLKLKVNQKFVVHFVQNNAQDQRVFKICGIYKTGLEEYDKKFALVDLAQVQELLGWSSNQIAGFEVYLDNLEDLRPMRQHIYEELISNELVARTVRDEEPQIFDWLDLQDVNEQVILALMLIVSVINMITALLILILERTNMIGTLKAMGSRNWSIQKIFLYYGAIIVCVGLAIGNLFGLGLAWLEQKFKFIKLSEADYYLSYAPIRFDFWTILWLNLGTLGITVLFLLLPTLMVLSISPVKAIRFK
jgi:lipoprotein-releasing system permease protein